MRYRTTKLNRQQKFMGSRYTSCAPLPTVTWARSVRFKQLFFLGRLSSCWTTASSFRQPPSTRCSTVSARYVRPSHLHCRWTNDMELAPKQFAWAGHANWLFVVHWRRVFLISTRHIERIRGAFCDDALYKSTFTFTFTLLLVPVKRVGFSSANVQWCPYTLT